jgi:hypothetical protein
MTTLGVGVTRPSSFLRHQAFTTFSFFLADSQHSVVQIKYTRSSNFKPARLKKGRAGKENFAYCRIFGLVSPYTVNILGFPIAGSNMQSASDFFLAATRN